MLGIEIRPLKLKIVEFGSYDTAFPLLLSTDLGDINYDSLFG
jgi:hypothetical protein